MESRSASLEDKLMPESLPVKSALLSVSDKTGLVDFCHGLSELGVNFFSTGGTSKALRQAELKVTDVSDLTGFPEILDGRVKTLNPKVFGGLLGLRDKQEHVQQMEKHGIQPLDMVVVNLYPFEAMCNDNSLTELEWIEYVDIGGPSLLRAASKNFHQVVVLCHPADYQPVLEELKQNKGKLSYQTRRRLAAKAFEHTSHYDSVIAASFRQKMNVHDFPGELSIGLRKQQDLRYGENPHQKAAVYQESGMRPWGVVGAKILQGKAISFNNYLDCDAVWRLVSSFQNPACVIIKHNNPCGTAEAESLADAFKRAYAADSVSAFGGIVGFNRAVDAETAQELSKLFLECIMAPGYHDDAKAILAKKTNLRVLEQPTLLADPYEWDVRRISGGFLLQDQDSNPQTEMKVVSRRKPTPEEQMSLEFAWKVSKYVKSNAIVLVRGRQTLGVGAGQMSRVDSLKVAVMKMQQSQGLAVSAQPLVLASDGFFPFRDTLDEAAKIGVTAVIQPGGSVRDEESVQAANDHNMAMIVTGVRHFRH